MIPGSRMQLGQALAELGLSPRPTRTSQQVTQYGSLLVVNTDSRIRAHFCVQRNVQLDATGLKRGPVEAHLDWLLDSGQNWGDEPTPNLHILAGSGSGPLTYVGKGRRCMFSRGGEEQSCQYALSTDLPEELDDVLMPGERRTGFGEPETSELIRRGLDFDAIRQVAESWLGPLPPTKPPEESKEAPVAVRQWHALWSQLSTRHDHPWMCWPACWRPGKRVSFFQDEWQNGDIYAVHADGSVWGETPKFAGEDQLVRIAPNMESFALGFLIEGLLQGAFGLYLSVSSDMRECLGQRLAELPLEPWPTHAFAFDEGAVHFAGATGALGTIAADGTIALRCTNMTSLSKLAGLEVPPRWADLPPPPPPKPPEQVRAEMAEFWKKEKEERKREREARAADPNNYVAPTQPLRCAHCGETAKLYRKTGDRLICPNCGRSFEIPYAKK